MRAEILNHCLKMKTAVIVNNRGALPEVVEEKATEVSFIKTGAKLLMR